MINISEGNIKKYNKLHWSCLTNGTNGKSQLSLTHTVVVTYSGNHQPMKTAGGGTPGPRPMAGGRGELLSAPTDPELGERERGSVVLPSHGCPD